MINLTGLTRFEILEETQSTKLYREFKVNYDKFSLDFKPLNEKIKIEPLIDKAKMFFEKNGLY